MSAGARLTASLLAGIVSCFLTTTGKADGVTSVEALIEMGDLATAHERALGEVAALASDTTRAPATKLERVVELSEALLDAGASREARALAEAGLALCEEADPACAAPRASARSILMQCAFASGELDLARRHQLEVVAFERKTDPEGLPLIDALRDLGFLEYRLEAYGRAADAWRETVRLAAAAPGFDASTLAWCESDLAEANRILGRFTAAESLLVSAVRRVREQAPATSLAATIINNLGALYWDQGRLDEAERLYTEALAVSENDPEPSLTRIATAYQNLGVLARDQARIAASARQLTRALELAREAFSPDDPAFINFLVDLATTLGELDRWEDAFALYDEALALLDEAADPRDVLRAKLLHDLGEAYVERGELAHAEARLGAALALRRRVLGPSHVDVGVTLAALARLHEAAGRTDDAARATEDALAILSTTHIAPEVAAETYALRARIAMARGRSSAALSYMEQALDRLDALRARRGGGDMTRARFVEEHLAYYGDAVAWLVSAGDVGAALQVSERARARVLRDRLAAARVDLRADVPRTTLAPLERREQDARARIAQYQRRLAALRAKRGADADEPSEITRLEHELDDALTDYREAVQGIELASPTWSRVLTEPGDGRSALEGARRALDDDEAVLFYHVAPQAAFGFLIPPAPREPVAWRVELDEADARRVGLPEGPLTGEALASLVAPEITWTVEDPATRGLGGVYREVAGADAPESLPDRLHVLWRALVPEDIWRTLAGVSELVVVPDGPMHLLPFEALVTAPAGDAAERTYWLDTGPPLRYAHSLATLGQLSSERGCTARGDGIVSFSDPEFLVAADEVRGVEATRAGAALVPLPGTRRESAAIAALFDPGRVALFSGSSATEARLRERAPHARYLHLATHGLVDDDRSDLLASLVLSPPDAPGSEDDGFLHLFEIYELDLCCELAVLSACDTRRGIEVGGEGVFAISRGFLAAGARRTIASLWSVADASTAALMSAFFERVAARERGESSASYAVMLRDAKREMRAREAWRSPFYWAPFVLSGAR